MHCKFVFKIKQVYKKYLQFYSVKQMSHIPLDNVCSNTHTNDLLDNFYVYFIFEETCAMCTNLPPAFSIIAIINYE